MRNMLQHQPASYRQILLAGAFGLCLGTAVNTWAQSTSTASDATHYGSTSTHTGIAHVDSAFLKDAALAGQWEVEAGKKAIAKSQDPDVRSFAQTMVDDHSKVNDQVTTLASSKGVQLPTQPSVGAEAKLKLLDMLNGPNFDKHYISNLGVDAHQDTVKLFKKYINDAKDDDVKAFAQKTLPALEHHLEMAQQLKARTDKKSN